MRSYFFTGFLLITVAACQNRQPEIVNYVAETNTNSVVVSESKEGNLFVKELIEFFSDDSKIGSPRKNKIELSHFKISKGDLPDSNKVEIKFYSLAEIKNGN